MKFVFWIAFAVGAAVMLWEFGEVRQCEANGGIAVKGYFGEPKCYKDFSQ